MGGKKGKKKKKKGVTLLKIKKALSRTEQALRFCHAHGQVQTPKAKSVPVMCCTHMRA